MEKIEKKLLSYQIDHVNNLIRIITNNNAVLDSSDTGTGKTYSAIATCVILNKKPIIICPKSVMSSWLKVCKYFDITPFFIVNYETIRQFKYYDKNRDRVKCPYIKEIKINKKIINRNKNEMNEDFNYKDYLSNDNKYYENMNINDDNLNDDEIAEEDDRTIYEWNVPKDAIFIFDEVHRATHLSTQNGKLLYSAKMSKRPLMILSATIADRPDKFILFFWVLNFIDPLIVKENKITYRKYVTIMNKWLTRDQQPMMRIHHMLYPSRASRIRIDNLGSLFPETQITAEPYNMGKSREIEIEKQYKIIADELESIYNKEEIDSENMLVKVLRAHQKIEILKIPTFVELANDLLVSNYSVVIFVNYNQTLTTLSSMLHTDSIICGGQDQEKRDKIINNFNDNKTKIIICNIKAGGVGISLHDIHGNHPRASLISPTWNSLELVQALGRIHRAGGLSKSIQRIVYAANTIEEKIADRDRKSVV